VIFTTCRLIPKNFHDWKFLFNENLCILLLTYFINSYSDTGFVIILLIYRSCTCFVLTECRTDSDWAEFKVPLNTLQVISGTGFYGSNDPTNSVKVLKEEVVLRTGFNPTRSTSPCYNTTHYTCMQCTQSNTHTKMNLCHVKWAQWDKTQSRELLGLFVCVCIALCTIVAHNIAQNRPDNFPSYPPDNHHCSDDVYLIRAIAVIRLSVFLDVTNTTPAASRHFLSTGYNRH